MRIFSLLPALCGFLLSTLHAQTPAGTPGTGEDSITSARDITPVEVRGVRASDVSPFAKTDLRAKDIQKLNLGQDFPYLLQYTPSVVTTSDAGAGVGYTGLRVRGTDGTRINVTLNGVPVNDAESQGTFFVNFGDIASSTGSVQLQRGVGTSTNGAGAFGATLSIDNLAQRDTAGADVTVTAGSFNTQRYTLRAGTGLLPGGFRVDARLSNIRSDGFIDRASSALRAAQLIGSWQASPRTRLRALVMTGTEKTYQAWNGVPEEKLRGDDSALAAHYAANVGILYFTPEDSGNLYTADRRTYNPFRYANQTDNYQQDYYQLHTDHRFSERLQGHVGLFYTRGRGYYEEYKYAQNYDAYGLPPRIAGTDTAASTDLIRQLWLDNHFYGGVFSLHYGWNKTALTLGGGATQYLGNHYGFVKWAAEGGIAPDHRWYDFDAQKNDFNGYLKAQQGVGERLLLFAEAQVRSVGYWTTGFRKAPTRQVAVDYTFFNPKGGFTLFLQKTPGALQRLYGSAAVASREPNRNDFEDAVTGTEPRPERLTDFEAGYEIRRVRWTAGINSYYMRYRDQLVVTGQVNDVGEYIRANVPRSYRAGAELQGAWLPARWITLSGNLTLSRNRVEDFSESVPDYDNGGEVTTYLGTTNLAFSPGVIGALVATFKPLDGLEFDLAGKHVGRQFLDNTGADSRSISAYSLLDVRLRYRLPLRRPDVLLNVQLANALNRRYESNGYTYGYLYGGVRYDSNWYYPQAGRNVLAGVTVGL